LNSKSSALLRDRAIVDLRLSFDIRHRILLFEKAALDITRAGLFV
jgi:hypothetical protein